MKSIVKDMSLAPGGHDKIEWVKNFMPVMSAIDKEFSQSKPFAGKKISITLHLEERRLTWRKFSCTRARKSL